MFTTRYFWIANQLSTFTNPQWYFVAVRYSFAKEILWQQTNDLRHPYNKMKKL